MRVAYSVTYEFPERAPVTHRGVIGGGQPATCVSRAVRQAQRALRPKGWSSLVCVLLERLDKGDRPQAADEPDAEPSRDAAE
jgi:hypothetical protein